MTRKYVSRAALSASFVLASAAVSLPARAEEPQASVWFRGLHALLAPTPVQPPGEPAPAAKTTSAQEADRGAEQSTPSLPKREAGFVPVLRLGFATAGKGEVTSECSGAFSCSDVSAVSYDENDSQMVGADFLWHTSPKLRLGIGTSLIRPNEKIEGNKFALGTEIGLHAVVEGVFPASESFALTLRAQVGALVLIPGEDLVKAYDELRQLCRDSEASNCNTARGPFVGRSTALGIGGRFQAGSVGVRIDLMGEVYSVKTTEFTVTDGGTSGTISTSHAGLRSWLLAGMEL